MAATGGGKKGGKKKKGQTVSLNEFLGDSGFIAPTKKVNWAEESDGVQGSYQLAEEYGGPPMDLRNLPSAPRSSRNMEIDMSRLPSRPPYIAFLANLPWDVKEEDIRSLFHGLRVENIRFPLDQGGRMKGFGYAEFFDIEELKTALNMNNEKIGGRSIRIDIAGQTGKDGSSRDSNRDQADYDDKTSGDWRRDGGPPANDGRRGGDTRGDSRGDFGPRPVGPADTDDCWRRNDGPSAQPSSFGWGNERGGRGREDAWGSRSGGGFRDGGGGRYGDDRGGRYGDDRGGRYGDDRGGRYGDDRGGRYGDDRGGRFRDERGGRFRDGGFDGNRDGPYRDDRRFNDEPKSEEPPQERKKLNLKPRTVEPQSKDSGSTSASIFGGAKPVDTASKEREIEEKLSSLNVNGDSAKQESRNFRRDHSGDRPRDRYRDNSRGRGRDDAWDRNRDHDRPREYNRDHSQEYYRDRPQEHSRGRSREYDRSNPQEYDRGRLENDRDRYQDDRRGPPPKDSHDSPPVRSPNDYRGVSENDTPDRDHDLVRGGDRDRPRDNQLYEESVRADERDREIPRERNRNYERDTERALSPGDRYRNADYPSDKYNSGEEYRNPNNDTRTESVENWRDEGVRHDRSSVMRPDAVKDRLSVRTESREDMYVLRKTEPEDQNRRPLGKSPKDKRWNKEVIPPKYEEPPQPVFVQSSRYAALGLGSDDDDENSNDEEKNGVDNEN